MNDANRHSVEEYMGELLSTFHPGQRVTIRTLRLVFARRKWNMASPAVQEVYRMLYAEGEAMDHILEAASNGPFTVRGGDGNIYMRRLRAEEKKTAILDVSNLVWSFHAARPKLEPLVPVVRCIREHGVASIIAVADANLPYVVADAADLRSLQAEVDHWVFARGGTPADKTIIHLAEQRMAWIGSNDRFREWRKSNRWAKTNLWRILVPVVFVPPHSCDLGIIGDELRS